MQSRPGGGEAGPRLALDVVDAELPAPPQVRQDVPHGEGHVAAGGGKPAPREGALGAERGGPRDVVPLRPWPAQDRVSNNHPRLHRRRVALAALAVVAEGGARRA